MMRFSRAFLTLFLSLTAVLHVGAQGEEEMTKMTGAIKRGDLATVQQLLKEGLDPNLEVSGELPYRTLLSLAIRENLLPITKALLEAKADPMIECDNGDPAMVFAADPDRLPHAKLLIQHGVSIDSKNRGGETALIRKAGYASARDAQAIVDLGASIDLVAAGGETALMRAAENANSAFVGVLLKAGADPNLANAEGKTALMLALDGGKSSGRATGTTAQVVEMLIDAGANINETHPDGRTVLILALDCESSLRPETENAARIVKMLLEAGADINKTDPYGRTALMLALDNRQVKKETIEVLLAANPKVELKDKEDRDALMLALSNGDREIHMHRLIELGADIGTSDNEGVDLLMLAAKQSKPALVADLLGKGLSPQAKSHAGETAVHAACDAYFYGNDPFGNDGDTHAQFCSRVTEILKLLHEKGASLNAPAHNKLTALHLAAEQGNAAAVSYLLPHYPDVDIADEDGSTALHFAAAHDSVAVIDLLLPKSKVVDPRDVEGLTPLAYAAGSRSAEAVVRLKAAGADIDTEDKNGVTPLERAVVKSEPTMIKLLLKQGADARKLKNPQERLLTAVRKFHDQAISAEDYALNIGLFAGLSNDIDARDADGMTALIWVAASNNPEALKAVLARAPDLEARSADGRTALMWAASTRAAAAMETLKKAGADEASRDPAGKTAADWMAWSKIEEVPGDEIIPGGNDGLWDKIRRGQREELGAYLAKGSWDERDRIGGEAPLHLAAGLGDIAAIEILLNRGAAADQGLNDRRTPLMEAAAQGQVEAMSLLLQRGANPKRRDRDQIRAIDLAVHFRHGEAIRLLLDQAEPLGAEETELLARTVMIGDGDLLRQLFKKGAKIRDFDPGAQEPEWGPDRKFPVGGALNAAARGPDSGMLRVLVEFPEASGAAHPALLAAAMHHAAENGSLENVKYLVEEQKVDIDSLLDDALGGTTLVLSSEQKEGKETRFSAASRAIEQGHEDLLRYLVERGAKIQGRTRGGEPPLSFAVSRGDAEMASYLLDHKAATEIRDFDGKTALHHAAEKNRRELVKLLLERGAKRDAKDDCGKTPLDLALEAKAEEASEELREAK